VFKNSGSVAKKKKSLKLYLKKFCHEKTVGDKAILISWLNSAWKNTLETQINFCVTKIVYHCYQNNLPHV
jgi:hypothetical protein